MLYGGCTELWHRCIRLILLGFEVGFEWRCAGNVGSVYLDFDDTITVGLSTNVQVKAVIEGIAKVGERRLCKCD